MSALSCRRCAIQYADYAVWQREWLQGEVLQEQIDYWRDQLEGAPALELPTDRPRPAVASHRGGSAGFSLSSKVTQALRQVSRQQGVTMFMALLAGFQALLARYSGQDDISVGTPIAKRNREETEGLIGFFVNTVVMRAELGGEVSVSEALRRVREAALGAYAHQDLPFEKLVSALVVERDISRTPLFQVMFAWQNVRPQEGRSGKLVVSSFDSDLSMARFDLTLTVTDSQEALAGIWEFSTDLFDRETIEQMIGHYQTLLEALAANPEARLSEIPILSQHELHQLLSPHGYEESAHLMGNSLQELFEAQVERSPEAIALVYGEKQLSYQELNCSANRLAHYLRSMGVGAESRVGLSMERTAEMVIGLLGILKSGGAYVPLDPAYPAERLRFIIEDAGIEILVTQQALLSSLPEVEINPICVDSCRDLIDGQSGENPPSVTDRENLAYIIYTSGSTGKPKGVAICHEQVIRLFAATEDWYGFDHSDVWTLFHSYAFDFSVWEIWGALLYGGRLVGVPYLVSRSPDSFYRLLDDERVSVLNQTPSAFRQLAQAEHSLSVDPSLNLRFVIFGGEALDMASLRPWFEQHGDQRPRLINMYGITETTVHVTYRPVALRDSQANGHSLIGELIPDLQLYLADHHTQLVPSRAAGEIYVGGQGLARCYLNNPALTAERFIPNGFDRRPGARLYKTGDLARRLACGDIDYLGRVDHQVKIRGFRIELGEIESDLTSHPSVRDAIVIAESNGSPDKHITAYVVCDRGQGANVNELRSYLKRRLPDYMVPATFIYVELVPPDAERKDRPPGLTEARSCEARSCGGLCRPGHRSRESLVTCLGRGARTLAGGHRR